MGKNVCTELRREPGFDRSQAGYSIIELLVCIVLFLVVTGAIYGMMEVTRNSRSTTNRRVTTMQTVRNSLNSIGRDALNTGYKYRNLGSYLPDNVQNTVFGLTADNNTTADRLMQVLSGNEVNTNVLLPSGSKTDQLTFVYGDESFNSGNTLPVYWVDCEGKQVGLTFPTGATLPSANDIMIITGQNSSAIGMVTSTLTTEPPSGTRPAGCAYAAPAGQKRTVKFASSDLLGINKTGTSNIIRNVTAPASLSRVRIVTYRVLNDSTLVRTEYGNKAGSSGSTDMPLASDVKNMQIKYVLDDGTLKDDPAAGPDNVLGNSDDTPTLLGKVRQVRISITTRSREVDPRTNQPVEVTLTSTFNTRNLGYDAQ